MIYVAEAEAFVPGAGQPDEWVLSSGFRPVSEVQALVLSPVQNAFLAAALRKRAGH